MPFAIYLYLECLLKKESRRNINLGKSYTEKKARHESSCWAMLTKCLFNKNEIINYEKEKKWK